MSISLKNHEDRISMLENNSTSIKSVICLPTTTVSRPTSITIPSDFKYGIFTGALWTNGGGTCPCIMSFTKGEPAETKVHLASASNPYSLTYDGNVTLTTQSYFQRTGYLLFKLYHNLKEVVSWLSL